MKKGQRGRMKYEGKIYEIDGEVDVAPDEGCFEITDADTVGSFRQILNISG